MKFLCDQMIAQLGRWLRCAGHDALIIDNGIADKEIMLIAQEQNRYLLTKDSHFLYMKDNDLVIHFTTNTKVEYTIHDLNKKLEIDWIYRPLSRCLACNGVLKEIDKDKITSKIPEGVKESTQKFWACPDCNRIYWLGSHT